MGSRLHAPYASGVRGHRWGNSLPGTAGPMGSTHAPRLTTTPRAHGTPLTGGTGQPPSLFCPGVRVRCILPAPSQRTAATCPGGPTASPPTGHYVATSVTVVLWASERQCLFSSLPPFSSFCCFQLLGYASRVVSHERFRSIPENKKSSPLRGGGIQLQSTVRGDVVHECFGSPDF